jgi:hypothetical protein
MDRTDLVILVNSTPNYYYILPFFFTMLRRYAPDLAWDLVLATEFPDDPICKAVSAEHGVEILEIPFTAGGFIDSRLAALQVLQKRYKYCLPLQDDFILEMPMNAAAIKDILAAMDTDLTISSARLMPCPGPAAADAVYATRWKILSHANNAYGFVYQATLWRTEDAVKWFQTVAERLESIAPKATTDSKHRNTIEVSWNIAENAEGQALFWKTFAAKKHLAWIRQGKQPNAVYLSPFPYRPTAIVKGRLESWASELAARESIPLGK